MTSQGLHFYSQMFTVAVRHEGIYGAVSIVSPPDGRLLAKLDGGLGEEIQPAQREIRGHLSFLKKNYLLLLQTPSKLRIVLSSFPAHPAMFQERNLRGWELFCEGDIC